MQGNQWGRVGRFIAAVGLVVAALIFPSTGSAQKADTPETLDDLFQIFNVNTIPADIIVVIDTSGSMSGGSNPPYPAVLGAFAALVEALPAGDNLSVITFDVSPTLAFQGAVGGDRAAALSALPAVAEGLGTDIGAAIEASLQRLDRADASQVQLVIFLTDGEHEPGRGSSYPTTAGAPWDQLRVAASEAADRRNVQVIGFSLGGLGAGGMDLLRGVYGNPLINAQPAEQLPEFFREAVRKTQLARLETEVSRDIDRGVTFGVKGDGPLAPTMEIDVPVRSNLEHLEATVIVESVKAFFDGTEPVEAEVVGASTFVLPPGGESTVTVRVETPVGEPGFKVPAEVEQRKVQVVIDASVSPEPARLLTEAVSPALAESTSVAAAYDYTGSRPVGWTISQFLTYLAFVALALFVLYLLWRRFLQVPPLVGGFVVTKDGKDDFIALDGKRMKLSGRLVPQARPAEIELFTRRGKPRRVYAQVVVPPFKTVTGRRAETVPSETEIRAGSYLLGAGRLAYRPRKTPPSDH